MTQGETDELILKKKKKVYLHKFLKKFKDYLPVFKRVFKNKKLLRYILKKIKCKSFFWKSELGLKDPALTGIISGILWIIKGNINMLVLNTFKFTGTRPYISITVDYSENIVFNTHLNCIFDFNMGHIMSIGMIILTALIKGGEKK